MVEFYEADVLPTGDGFDPSDASECFAPITITWLGQAYRRAVLGASDIKKSKGARANSCTVRLSNGEDTPEDADTNRYVANWVNSTQVEGMRMVVRLISRSASSALTDSAILFVGRCERPDGFDVIQGSITATADFGGVEYEFPPRLYTADDPEDRSPADPLYEGFPFIALRGTFQFQLPEQDRRYHRADPRRYIGTMPFSSLDDTPLGDPLPMFLGRTQHSMVRGVYVDEGRTTKAIDFIGMGPIAGVLNFRQIHDPDYARFFTQPQNVTIHLGLEGAANLRPVLFPTHPFFSNTAYADYDFTYIGTGAFTNIDAGQISVATILGFEVDLPDGSGVFNQTGWTDNGAYLARYLITNERFFNVNPAFIEDSACYATGQINDRPIFDRSNSETIYVPDPESGVAGTGFSRFHSTGLINVRRARFVLGIDSDMPEELFADDFTDFDPFDPPVIAVSVLRLRKNFTTNCLLKKRVKGLDFLHNTLYPSFRGFDVWNWRGKLEIRSEREADFAHLRASTAIGATALLVEDVTPWKAAGGLWGKVLVGAGLTTSESRKVTAAAYTADGNDITLTTSVSGAVTATASGATLGSGSSTVAAFGTVTIAGTPNAGNTVTVTINGIPVVYTLETSETTATVAYMVAQFINAHTQLRRFVSASASGAVVTVTAKWGVLTLSSALANTHGGPVANPLIAPTGITIGSSASTLKAGDWRIAYSNTNASGETLLTPYSTATITTDDLEIIVIPALALAAGATGRNWYMSKAPGDDEMVLVAQATGAGFNITAPPDSVASFPPEYNTTGEEVVRVAMSFASNNQTAAILAQAGLARGNIFANSYKWPLSGQQPSYTQIKIQYVNASADYAPSIYELNDRAQRARLGKVSPKEIDGTAIDNAHQARRIAHYDFAKFIDHHWFNTLSSNGLALLLEEDDVICSSDDSGGIVNELTRVEDFTIHLSDFTVTVNRARRYRTSMFRELVPKTNPVLPSVLRWTATLDTLSEIIDAPAIRPEHYGLPGVYIPVSRDAATLGDWRGSYPFADFGAGYRQLSTTPADVEAAIGVETGTPLSTPRTSPSLIPPQS